VAAVSVRIGCGLSTAPDPRVAAIEAGSQAREALGPNAADIAFLFCTGAHLAAPEAALEGVQEALDPPAVAGCGAGGVLSDGREIEEGTAVAVWAAALDGGSAEVFHAEALEMPDGVAVTGLADLEDATAAVLLPDPYSFPTDGVLAQLSRRAPGVPIVGGLSSARTPDGEAALFIGDRVVSAGAVAVRFDGVEVLPCVSQGAAPVGPELTVTAADGNVIHELAGRPALGRLRDAIEELTELERGMVANGLLLGVVIDGGKPEYRQGDFLVRALLGADPEEGTVAVGAPIEAGTVVRSARRGARVHVQRPRARDVRDARPRRDRARRGAGRRARGRVLRGGGDRPGRRRPVPPWVHRHRGSIPRVNLAGRTVLLTGATGGLGQAIARRLHAAGAQLVLTGRRTDVLEPLAQETGGRTLAVDLTDRAAVERLAADCADVDVLIANAGLPASGHVMSFSVEQIDRALDVNLRAPMVLARLLGDRMVERGAGHIVFVSSLSGKAATPRSGVYSATKFGLRGFAAGLRQDLRPRGVGVSAVFPGFVRDAGMFAESGAKLPPGVGTSTPEEVAAAVVRAIERNRGEVDVAPLPMRLGVLFSGVAPGVAAAVTRLAGGEGVGEQFGRGQASKR
jgi:uncharacterized protein